MNTSSKDRRRITISTKPNATFERLPIYYNYLKSLQPNPPQYISASAIANALNLGDVQVRKDLASVCMGGKPKLGYKTEALLKSLESELGFDQITNALMVGAGALGKALLGYKGFANYGLNIVAAFDIKKDTQGVEEKEIFLIDDFDNFCKEHNIKIGIITTPPDQAQKICDLMIQNDILAIWNFTQTHLSVPKNVLVYNENLANSLALLSAQLRKQMFNQNNNNKGV